MREILFRGKQEDSGEWVYGDLIHRRILKKDVTAIRVEDSGFDYYLEYDVIPETVGQYTGLTDKTGKKIFEGDILAIGENGQQYQMVLVSFKDGAFRVSHYAVNLLECRNVESEVIGNVYDNPELLEV